MCGFCGLGFAGESAAVFFVWHEKVKRFPRSLAPIATTARVPVPPGPTPPPLTVAAAVVTRRGRGAGARGGARSTGSARRGAGAGAARMGGGGGTDCGESSCGGPKLVAAQGGGHAPAFACGRQNKKVTPAFCSPKNAAFGELLLCASDYTHRHATCVNPPPAVPQPLRSRFRARLADWRVQKRPLTSSQPAPHSPHAHRARPGHPHRLVDAGCPCPRQEGASGACHLLFPRRVGTSHGERWSARRPGGPCRGPGASAGW